MEKRIRPWIHKKIIEYIGEPEPTLVDFICSKVLVGSDPQSILDDVQMVSKLDVCKICFHLHFSSLFSSVNIYIRDVVYSAARRISVIV